MVALLCAALHPSLVDPLVTPLVEPLAGHLAETLTGHLADPLEAPPVDPLVDPQEGRPAVPLAASLVGLPAGGPSTTPQAINLVVTAAEAEVVAATMALDATSPHLRRPFHRATLTYTGTKAGE